MSDEDVTRGHPPTDRRAFLKRLTGDAIEAAEMLARSRSLPARSAAAAVEAANTELGIDRQSDSDAGSPAATSPVRAAAARLRPLTDGERRMLEAATVAVVAVNVPDGAPHLSQAPFHWDGEVARLLGGLFGARVSHTERDGRLSLLIEDATGWLTLTGEARVITGTTAIDEARGLLAHLYSEPAEVAWSRLTSDGDQAVTVVRPSRIVSLTG